MLDAKKPFMNGKTLQQVAGALITAAVLSAFATIALVIRMDTRQGAMLDSFTEFKASIVKQHDKYESRFQYLERGPK